MADSEHVETQQPGGQRVHPSVVQSTMPSGRASPKEAVEGGLLAVPPQSTTEKGPVGAMTHMVAQSLNVRDLIEARPANFELAITAIKITNTNYDPKKAVSNLNAQVQQMIATDTKIADIPRVLFRTIYFPPDKTASSEDYGKFLIRVPAPLIDLCINAAPPADNTGPLAFTGDDMGNSYALKYQEHNRRANKYHAPIPQDAMWLHAIPQTNTELTYREIYEFTRGHIDKYGFAIIDHPEAFHMIKTKDKEQATGKYHVAVTLDHAKIPVANGYLNMKGIDHVEVDPDTHERLKFWFTPKTLRDECTICSVCFNHLHLCKGHEDQPKNDGKRAATNDAAAQARIAKKASQASKFAF